MEQGDTREAEDGEKLAHSEGGIRLSCCINVENEKKIRVKPSSKAFVLNIWRKKVPFSERGSLRQALT